MLILGIETSCDDTGCAIVDDGRKVIINNVISQIEKHQEFGGVKPSVAKQAHQEVIDELIEKTLKDSNLTFEKIDAIAVTLGPGLVVSLLVGLNKGKELSRKYNKKLIGVNHLFGHICSNYLESSLEPPFICLLASGGHTQIIKVNNYIDYEIIGTTLDDACGEAFDKIGRLLGLPYPGGPHFEELAKSGNINAFILPEGKVPSYNFSFSGIKTAVLRQIEKLPPDFNRADMAASFQENVTNTLVKKLCKAAKETNLNKLVIAGGVSANKTLRKKLSETNYEVFMPGLKYCTDNAAMIASAGYFCRDIDQDFEAMDVFARDPSSIKLKPLSSDAL